MKSSSGCGTDDCGPTSATSRHSTMLSPPSTRPSDATGRRSSAFVHKDSETATAPAYYATGALVVLLVEGAGDARRAKTELGGGVRKQCGSLGARTSSPMATWESTLSPGEPWLSPTN